MDGSKCLHELRIDEVSEMFIACMHILQLYCILKHLKTVAWSCAKDLS